MPRLTTTLWPLSVLLAGCASSDEQPAEGGRVAGDCIFVSTIDDFRVLDDRNLIIYAPTRSSAYHVQLIVRCSSLRFTDQIGVSSRDGRLCGFGGDALIVPERPAPRRCSVDRITALSPGELDELLARYGKLKDGVAPAEPEESVESPQSTEPPQSPDNQ